MDSARSTASLLGFLGLLGGGFLLTCRIPGVAAEHLRIERTKPPISIRTLGGTDVFVEIRGTSGKPTEIRVPLPRHEAVWFVEPSLRLARWNGKETRFEFVLESSYDPKAEAMLGSIIGDGVYSIFGLSRAAHVYAAQARICLERRLEPRLDRSILWPDCTRILCPALDYRAWSRTWSEETGMEITPGDLFDEFGNVCEHCFEGVPGTLEYPECELVDLAPIDPGELIPIWPNLCPDCVRVCPDDDGDTVCNDYEVYCLGTDPQNPDTDGDGLNDGQELDLGTDPKKPDTDGDALSDGDEVLVRQTNPLNKDTDADGLEDGWEVLGYDSDGNGTRDVNLSAMGANPRHKDVLVEVDWMFSDLNGDGDTNDAGEISFQPQQQAINGVVAAFANGPVPNPDGTTGINLIVNVSNGLPLVNLNNNLVVFDASGNQIGFSAAWTNIKSANMTPGMAGISRYCVFIRNMDPQGSSGWTEAILADDFVVSLGLWATPGGTLQQQQGTFMHELGHALGLYHGGTAVAKFDNNANALPYDRNFEPNYPSVMNYFHQTFGVVGNFAYGNPPVCANLNLAGRLCFTQGANPAWTYSRGLLPNVDEANLGEPAGIAVLPGPIDWNIDGDSADLGISINLNGDTLTGVNPANPTAVTPVIDVQTDNNDWAGLVLKFW